MQHSPSYSTAGLRSEIAAERRELADVLHGLSPSQWNSPSLCTGWRVREVAAHMSLGFRHRIPRIAAELVRSRGSLDRMTDRFARRDAGALTGAQLAAALRDNADHPWTPPVGGPAAALGHDVVHGLDITVALGLARRVPAERLLPLLAEVTPRTLRFFGARLENVRLRATDLDWSYGSGSRTVARPAEELLLLAYGRRVPGVDI
ncbi:maleylpyruvate isomerase family mycothiol-dependent enzyme [Kitasatospora sp. NPDC057692]|uniref:maleylpyruvate isomerase family mycothiol-dependent enzyme n=1 Tax=Kitasatospora sp. NPDC057692 TaxID=3346215 RepID=UPI00368BF030